MVEAADLHIDLLSRLTDEQADQYARDLIFFGKAAIKQEADGSVRVVSPAELSPDYRGDCPLYPQSTEPSDVDG